GGARLRRAVQAGRHRDLAVSHAARDVRDVLVHRAVAVIVLAVAGLRSRGAWRAGLRDAADTCRHGALARTDPTRDVRHVVGGAVAVVVQSIADLCSRRTVRTGGNAQDFRLAHAQLVRAELITPDLCGRGCRIARTRRLVADHVAGEG